MSYLYGFSLLAKFKHSSSSLSLHFFPLHFNRESLFVLGLHTRRATYQVERTGLRDVMVARKVTSGGGEENKATKYVSAIPALFLSFICASTRHLRPFSIPCPNNGHSLLGDARGSARDEAGADADAAAAWPPTRAGDECRRERESARRPRYASQDLIPARRTPLPFGTSQSRLDSTELAPSASGVRKKITKQKYVNFVRYFFFSPSF
jgi:hypothetical protein